MKEILERQTINIAVDLDTAANANINVPINLRFEADEVTIKNLVYDSPDAVPLTAQIYTNLTLDPIIAHFGNAGVVQTCVFPEVKNTFTIVSRFRQGAINFQFQVATHNIYWSWSVNHSRYLYWHGFLFA